MRRLRRHFGSRARAAATVVLLGAATASACGTESADLLVIDRSGSLPDANLTLVVGDGGAVECNGEERPLAPSRLLDARQLVRDLEPLLARRVRLPEVREPLLRFRVMGEAGTVTFSDASRRQPPVLGRLLGFTRAVATESCGFER